MIGSRFNVLRAHDDRDLVIEHLTGRLLDYEDALVEAIRDREGYRSLAQQSIHLLAQLTRQLHNTREAVAQLRAFLRHERAK
jgi:hypothetical protein